MLAGKRLFWGENDYATVKLIQKTNVPRLSPLNREVDERFEEVLLRALTREPEHRYQSAREFGAALADYLFSHQLMVTAYDLARLVQSVTGEEAPTTTAANDPSLIDRLIQDELDESIGIGSQSGSLPKQGGSSGSLNLAADESFEDPASWFSDGELTSKRPPAPSAAQSPVVIAAAAAPKAAKPPPAPRSAAAALAGGARGDEPSGTWRESGIDDPDAPDTEPDDTVEDIVLSAGESLPPSGLPPSLAVPASSSSQAQAQAQAGGAAKIVIAIAVVAALAAAAWLGLRP
jgi:serine/threonine-protein kinase